MERANPGSVAVMATPAYRELVARRRRLIWPLALLLLGLLMAITALTVFTNVLDGQLLPGLNGAILMAYVTFFLPVAVAHLYLRRANDLDSLAALAIAQARPAEPSEEK